MVNDSYTGEMAIREGPWKLIQAPHRGGMGKLKGKHAPDLPPVQLFNLDNDPTESKNLYAEHPDKVARLKEILTEIRESGRSRPKDRSNPYLNTMMEHLRDVDATPRLPETLDSCWTFRALAEQAWAAGWDGSPRRGDEKLIARARSLISYCLEHQKNGTWFHSRTWKADDPNCYRERSLKNDIAWGEFAYVYPNQDVFCLYIMELAARWWQEGKYREAVKKTIAAIESQCLPDGGLRYIGPETECPVYHNVNVVWLTRYLLLTESERVKRLITRTLPYYPLTFSNEGFPESYTDCWWKHTWGDGSPTGPAIVAGITGDPQHAWLAQQLFNRCGARPNYWTIVADMTHRNGIETASNRNRFPTTGFGWTVISADHAGGPEHGTLPGSPAEEPVTPFAGAMICEPDREQPLNGAFLAANIEVATAGGVPRHKTCMYLSGPDDVTHVAMKKNAAVLGARYTLRKPYINSSMTPDVPPSSWPATQVWLFTPKGSRNAEGVFHCGGLRMELLGHNFDKVQHGRARPGYNRKSTQQSAVLLSCEGSSVRGASDARESKNQIAPRAYRHLSWHKRTLLLIEASCRSSIS